MDGVFDALVREAFDSLVLGACLLHKDSANQGQGVASKPTKVLRLLR